MNSDSVEAFQAESMCQYHRTNNYHDTLSRSRLSVHWCENGPGGDKRALLVNQSMRIIAELCVVGIINLACFVMYI